MASVVATRYARALADVALAPGAKAGPPQILSDLRTFASALETSAELRIALESPSISAKQKRAIVEALLQKADGSRTARNFLYLLIDHRRLNLLPEMMAALEEEIDRRTGRLRVSLESARELSSAQSEAIAAGLERATSKKVLLESTVNPDLIGGVRARVGSVVFDGSVAGRLEALERRLMAE